MMKSFVSALALVIGLAFVGGSFALAAEEGAPATGETSMQTAPAESNKTQMSETKTKSKKSKKAKKAKKSRKTAEKSHE